MSQLENTSSNNHAALWSYQRQHPPAPPLAPRPRHVTINKTTTRHIVLRDRATLPARGHFVWLIVWSVKPLTCPLSKFDVLIISQPPSCDACSLFSWRSSAWLHFMTDIYKYSRYGINLNGNFSESPPILQKLTRYVHEPNAVCGQISPRECSPT